MRRLVEGSVYPQLATQGEMMAEAISVHHYSKKVSRFRLARGDGAIRGCRLGKARPIGPGQRQGRKMISTANRKIPQSRPRWPTTTGSDIRYEIGEITSNPAEPDLTDCFNSNRYLHK